MSKVKAASDTRARRLEGILSTLKTIVNELTGIQISDIDVDANFLEAGIDFLTLSQASQVIQEKFGVKLSAVQMLEVHGTIAAVAGYLDQNLPPDSVTPDQSSDLEPLELPHTSPPVQTQIEIVSNGHEQQLVGASSLEKIMSQQLLLMSRQLEMLREQHHSPVPAPVMKTAPVAAIQFQLPKRNPISTLRPTFRINQSNKSRAHRRQLRVPDRNSVERNHHQLTVAAPIQYPLPKRRDNSGSLRRWESRRRPLTTNQSLYTCAGNLICLRSSVLFSCWLIDMNRCG